AEKGYRTLAVAMGESDENLKIVGLVALYDMPRPDAKKFIEELKSLGVSIKMLTGDALPIAKETASQVSIGDKITNAQEFRELVEKDPEKAAMIAEESDGFAEVYPQDKYSIVKSLQKRGHIVGMTGDGVNDAPSLKQAEVGIAVSTATDVAKGAASVVLTGEGLSNIVDLVKTGRMIYQRLLTWIFNKVVKTFQIVVFVVVAFLLTKKFIVSAFDVILLMFIVDFVTLSISTDNARWSKDPDTWDVKGIVLSSMLLGILVVIESLIILYIGMRYLGLNTDYNLLRTYSFSILFYFGIFTVFVVRERGHFWESIPSKSLLYTVIADLIVVTILVSVGIPGVKPIPITHTATVITLSLLFSFLVNDPVKYLMLRRKSLKSV
ncbi:MAG: HAD-IC family P-type ATPase, partial [Caldanaerobacter sp.]